MLLLLLPRLQRTKLQLQVLIEFLPLMPNSTLAAAAHAAGGARNPRIHFAWTLCLAEAAKAQAAALGKDSCLYSLTTMCFSEPNGGKGWRNKQRQTETNRDKQRQTETNRDKQRQTERHKKKEKKRKRKKEKKKKKKKRKKGERREREETRKRRRGKRKREERKGVR